ncbi:MAG: hypothetical protein ACI9MR_001818 [Myxococcota bacterium]|jgi:hypothetical protein
MTIQTSQTSFRAGALACLFLLTASVGACGDNDAGASGNFSDNDTTGGDSFSDTSVWNSATGATDTSTSTSVPHDTTGETSDADTTLPPPPPETEVDFDLRTPEAGSSFLYIPSAGLDALVVVDASTLQVHLVEVGVEPTLVRALPDDLGAIVLNEGSDDISLVRPRPVGETPAGEVPFEVTTLDIVPDHNRLELSPDGAWAFVWFDHRLGATGGFGSLQDVSAIRLASGEEGVFNLVVGDRPEDLEFSAAGRLALFFCREGISGIALTEISRDTFLPPVPLHPDPFHNPVDREIAVTPDGTLAVVRDLSQQALTLVDLQTRQRWVLPLVDYPSDLELTPDGSTVVIPMKNTQQVAVISVDEAFTWVAPEPDPNDPDAVVVENPHVTMVFTGFRFGSAVLTEDGLRALLYTTEPGTQAIGMLDITAGTAVFQRLIKEVESLLVSPDGRMAALLYRKASGEAAVASMNAYSLLDLNSGFAKQLFVDNRVDRVIFTGDSSELFVLMPDPGGNDHLIHRVSTLSFNVLPYLTNDAPVFVGAMPSINKVAIALDNPTGWITFIDTDSGAVDQVNSFELNSFIR